MDSIAAITATLSSWNLVSTPTSELVRSGPLYSMSYSLGSLQFFLQPVGVLESPRFVVRHKGFGILKRQRELIVTIFQLCSLFGVLHETTFVLLHLRFVISDGFSEVPIVEIFYHLLQLAIDFNKEA